MDFNKDTIKHLSELSDDELTKLLAEQIKIKKENGTLGELEKMIRIITPFLNDSQKQRLTQIIAKSQEQ